MSAARDALVEASERLLEPGEVVANVVKANEGPKKSIGVPLAMFVAFGVSLLVAIPVAAIPIFILAYQRIYAKRLILATDLGVVLVSCSRWNWRPKKVMQRFDIDTMIGPLEGSQLRTVLGGHQLFVLPRWKKEVEAADADHPGA